MGVFENMWTSLTILNHFNWQTRASKNSICAELNGVRSMGPGEALMRLKITQK